MIPRLIYRYVCLILFLVSFISSKSQENDNCYSCDSCSYLYILVDNNSYYVNYDVSFKTNDIYFLGKYFNEKKIKNTIEKIARVGIKKQLGAMKKRLILDSLFPENRLSYSKICEEEFNKFINGKFVKEIYYNPQEKRFKDKIKANEIESTNDYTYQIFIKYF